MSPTESPRRRPQSSSEPTPARSSSGQRRSASPSSTRRNSCAAPAPNPKLASDMSAPVPVATDGLMIGRGALRQLHVTLRRDAPDSAVTILQETEYAAGAGVFEAFRAWLPGETGVAQPDALDAGR